MLNMFSQFLRVHLLADNLATEDILDHIQAMELATDIPTRRMIDMVQYNLYTSVKK